MPELNLEGELMSAVRNGLSKAVCEKLTGYNSPLDKVLSSVIETQANEIRTLLLESIATAMKDAGFREHIATAVRTKLAKTLVEKFGGEMEKQVNLLKSDPTTRARITTAIDDIIKANAKAS